MKQWNTAFSKLFAATPSPPRAFVSLAQPAEAAVTATLNVTTLEVTGDGANDIITLRLEAGNPANLQVFDGAILVNTFAIAGITVIDVDGGAGNDTILVDEANGAIAVAGGAADFLLDGGDGDDTITGGSDAETLNGGNNNDTLLGRGGIDILNGGDGNDTLTGGPGGAPTPGNFEPHNGGPGDDTFIWFNGDGSDIVEGGDGNDTQRFDGNVAAADDMDARPRRGGRTRAVHARRRQHQHGHRHHREPADQLARRQRRHHARPRRSQRADPGHGEWRRGRRHHPRRRRSGRAERR